MYTLEIDGTPVAVTDADEAGAQEIFASDDFREDLRTLTSDGKPLWNGTSAFTVRPANDDESDLFEEAVVEEDEDDADDEEPGFEVMFLVPVDQFGEDDDEDEA
ncbi:hypothetical protein [Chthonobacter rhizosphaerae]|uniref:hypothetical protein n=1 Tax=Chthonobacter rhizosphaerae TaxID=2735553 RepID=UPI0015EF3CF7|nr:hypothetical protein [Chthonobacter rhizosphaerae]